MEQDENDLSLDDLLNFMIKFFKETNELLRLEQDKLGEIDKELSDLDHYLENNELQAGKLSKLAKIRKAKRKERREIKNNIDVLQEVQRFTEKYNNKLIEGDIILLKKNLAKLEERHLNPVYAYRTDILQRSGLINGCTYDDNDGDINVDVC